jgi:hypothetical protein
MVYLQNLTNLNFKTIVIDLKVTLRVIQVTNSPKYLRPQELVPPVPVAKVGFLPVLCSAEANSAPAVCAVPPDLITSAHSSAAQVE